MPKIIGPRKTNRYPDEFKIRAVQRVDQPDILAKDVVGLREPKDIVQPEFRWNPFNSRREFFKLLVGFLMKSASVAGLMMTGVRSAAAFFDKELLPVGTDPGSLYDEDPEYLDIRNLEISPINKFDTMGDSQVEVDLENWRLEVTGDVR